MENYSGDENSDDGLQIVIESPRPKKPKNELNETDKKIIESVEKDLEENLEEKAAKANLTATNVKNIIKEVITNEHVLALVRHAEKGGEGDEPPTVYEPKYTRAKTKQLLSENTQQKVQNVLPWMSPAKTVSEVQMLFTEDLQEDSSGDEYIPERAGKITTVDNSQLDTSGCSKKDDKATIALRTRSKLSLSHTPLEVIEEAFMPPDITTDMYDMDCDDDVWKEFLKTFTRPLDEVNKAAEDEDHDPEYNVLADEEIDEVDKEELRADRAVTVSRKEFNCLMAELFEFADIYESNKQSEKNSNDITVETENVQNTDAEDEQNISITKCQIFILAQQMRQHVQMLTQNYLLSYENPEFHDIAPRFKSMLIDIMIGSDGKDASIYYATNLPAAIDLIDNWEQLYASKNEEALECKRYVEKVLSESIAAKRAGTEYIVSFPPLLLKTISDSEVFMYPNLLPRIPFRSSNITRSRYYFFTPGEENLIALFLEQSIPYLKQDPFYITPLKKLNMQKVCKLINILLISHVSSSKIARHIGKRKHPTCEENPIKFFYRNRKAPAAVHYVIPVDEKNMLPPCKRAPEELPYQWRRYLYPNEKTDQNLGINSQWHNIEPNNNSNQVILVSCPLQVQPVINPVASVSHETNFSKRFVAYRKLLPKGPLLPTINCSQKRKRSSRRRRKNCKVNNNKENKVTSLVQFNVNKIKNKMLPDMPSLGNTPGKTTTEQKATNSKDNDANPKTSEQNLSFRNISSFGIQFIKPDSVNKVKRNFESISEFNSEDKQDECSGAATSSGSEKDNPDDIHELMIASSTVKNVTKKEPSGAEKKRAKLRREFVSNLIMATPDDLETQIQKEENAFFDKLRQTLTMEDYDRLIDILGHYDETNGDFLELFKNVQSVLSPSYKELGEEFYLFLTDIQAQKVGQLMPYFVMKDMDRFMRKLHIYFKDQPTQMKKIIKCLTDLSEKSDVTMDTIKSSVLPLFKGNAALADWFLQIFPCERPPKMLTAGPHEVIDISKELARQPGEEICETVVLPDTEDPYGGANCICPCHNVENPQFKSRFQHCKKCGLKFLHGKIYIQTAKTLRPAVVSFLTNPEKDHTKRLAATQRKRSDTSPSKQINSPNKDGHTQDEMRHSNESDDDESKKKKQPKKQRKRKVADSDKLSAKESGKTTKENSLKGEKVKTVKLSVKRQNKKRLPAKKSTEHKPGSTAGQQKRLTEEPEVEYSEPAEYVELKVSSEHSGESGSEFFESSQDVTNTDSEESSDSVNPNSSQTNVNSKETSWSREEDKIILQAFKESSDNEETFKYISEVLESRSVVEIKNRFHKLMTLLQQMASK